MSDIKQCDICKKEIKDYYYVVNMYKAKVGQLFYLAKPQIYIEICFNCFKKGITLAYSDFRKRVSIRR